MKEPTMIQLKPVRAIKLTGDNFDEVMEAFENKSKINSIYELSDLLGENNIGVWVIDFPIFGGYDIVSEARVRLHFDVEEKYREACSRHTGFKV